MNERVAYQFTWLEAAVERVNTEAEALANIVEGGREKLEDLRSIAAALHLELEAVKPKLGAAPAEILTGPLPPAAQEPKLLNLQPAGKYTREFLIWALAHGLPPRDDSVPGRTKSQRRLLDKLYKEYTELAPEKTTAIKEDNEAKENRSAES